MVFQNHKIDNHDEFTPNTPEQWLPWIFMFVSFTDKVKKNPVIVYFYLAIFKMIATYSITFNLHST